MYIYTIYIWKRLNRLAYCSVNRNHTCYVDAKLKILIVRAMGETLDSHCRNNSRLKRFQCLTFSSLVFIFLHTYRHPSSKRTNFPVLLQIFKVCTCHSTCRRNVRAMCAFEDFQRWSWKSRHFLLDEYEHSHICGAWIKYRSALWGNLVTARVLQHSSDVFVFVTVDIDAVTYELRLYRWRK